MSGLINHLSDAIYQTETAFLLLYIFVGALFWAVFGYLLLKSKKRMRLVRNPPDQVPGLPPLVTILMPAKDEQDRVRGCLESILKQDYPNFNVIAIDDRSHDRTGSILDEIAAADPRLKVLHIRDGELPPNWSGKNHALHCGSQMADGTYLLFVDADVILYPNALRTALGMAMCRQYDLVSLMPRMEFHSFWEGVLTPLGAFAAAMLHLASLTNANNLPRTAFANGQFMLFKREAYDKIGGHERVRNILGEDTALARLLKRNGMRPRVTWGADLCQVRMYDSMRKILYGWSRILFATAESVWRNVIGFIGALVLVYSLLPAGAWAIHRLYHPVGWFAFAWSAAVILHWVNMTIMVGWMYRMACTKAWYALVLVPVSGPLLLFMLGRSIYLGLSRRVEWRGTRYAGNAATMANAQQ